MRRREALLSAAMMTGIAGCLSSDSSTVEQWQFQTDKRIFSTPAVVNNTVYFGSSDKYVYAVNATDGTELWRFQTHGRVVSSPTVLDGTVYLGSEDNHVYALDANDGTAQWRFRSEGAIGSSPAVTDGTVYVGCWCQSPDVDGMIHALDPDAGSEKWRFRTDQKVDSSPAVADGTQCISGVWIFICMQLMLPMAPNDGGLEPIEGCARPQPLLMRLYMSAVKMVGCTKWIQTMAGSDGSFEPRTESGRHPQS